MRLVTKVPANQFSEGDESRTRARDNVKKNQGFSFAQKSTVCLFRGF